MFSCPVVHSNCFCSKFYHQLGASAGVYPQAKAVRLAIMIFMPLSQFVAVWLIRKVHSVVLQSGNCTEHPSGYGVVFAH